MPNGVYVTVIEILAQCSGSVEWQSHATGKAREAMEEDAGLSMLITVGIVANVLRLW